jgi:putative ABC transport system permease protein
VTTVAPDLARWRGLHSAGGLPLARRILLANKGRLLRSIAGIAFAVLLMLMQMGFEQAFFNSSLQLIHSLDGDIIIQNAHKYRFFTRHPFPLAELDRARQVPGVASARPFYASWFDFAWKNPRDGKIFMIRAFAFDPEQPVLHLPDLTTRLSTLTTPDTVVVDRRSRRFLGMGDDVGETETELNGTSVNIVGRFSFGPDFQSDGTVIMSSETFLDLLLPGSDQGVEAGVIMVEPGNDPRLVARALQAALSSDIAVFTRAELLQFERNFQANVSSIGPIFAMGTIVGFIVGALISYLVVYTDLSDQLPQYATLKAMGYEAWYIVGVVVRQAALLALCGWASAWVGSLLLYRAVSELALIPLATSPQIALVSLALTFGMCLLSAGLAMVRVITAEPAEVLF